jgi:hypothetical protein
MIYEERYSILTSMRTRGYREFCFSVMFPRLRAAGGEPLLFLTSLIGDPANSVLQVTRYPDFASWQTAQDAIIIGRDKLVDSEQVRLLKSVSSRPKAIIPREDHRAVYSHRHFYITPADLPAFVESSENAVWPLYEAADVRLFGLFTPAWGTNPLEVILMAGYNDPGHWMETRFVGEKPPDVDEKTWQEGRARIVSRGDLSVRGSSVHLWRAHEF